LLVFACARCIFACKVIFEDHLVAGHKVIFGPVQGRCALLFYVADSLLLLSGLVGFLLLSFFIFLAFLEQAAGTFLELVKAFVYRSV
jgi:hypothetical protein